MEPLRREAAPFDRLAERYDASFTTSALGKCLRAFVWERLDATFGPGARVLDIGCGTGEDAVHLACRGIEVLATDTSLPMLKVARQKAQRAGCAHRVQFRAVSIERLGAEYAGEQFDGVFSNFGAVNCVEKLDCVVAEVASVLRPGAPLVWVLMGRYVPWEWGWFLGRGEWGRAFRRLQRGGAVWRGMRIQYPTPAQLARMLSPHFLVVRGRPLGVVLPPSYASGWLERAPRTLKALTHLDRLAQRWQSLSAIADHYILEAVRSSASTILTPMRREGTST